MTSSFLNFSRFQNQLYALASQVAAYVFVKLQEVLPLLTPADAKTMILGAAFFNSINNNWVATSVFTFVGAALRKNIMDLGKKGVVLFNAQTSEIKYMIVAGAIIAWVIFYIFKMLKPIANAAIGLYTGVVFGKS